MHARCARPARSRARCASGRWQSPGRPRPAARTSATPNAGWTAYADPGSPPDPQAAERWHAARERHARLIRTPTAEHAARLREGHPVTVTVGDDGLPLGDLGNANVDRQLLELLLVNETPAARFLRAHGIDEARLRDELGPHEPPG